MYIESEGVLSLYAIGKTNGVMVHSGETCTHIASMFDGIYSAKPICLPTVTSGQQFTEKIKSLLSQQLSNDQEIETTMRYRYTRMCF